MIHRREFAMAGLSATALAALQVAGLAEERKTAGAAAPVDSFETCARACSDCQRECDLCATHCAERMGQGESHHQATLMSCRDCADMCSAASHIAARHGAFVDLVCQSCADACSRCAKECQLHGKDDKVMMACAEECLKCEKACRTMLTHTGARERP